jgi:signal peptidase I
MTALRRTLAGLWLGLAVSTLAIVVIAQVAPAVGLRIVIVGGGSMSPVIPIGSLLIERPPAGDVAAGAVVTMDMPNGTLITHRVTRLVALQGVPYLETHGDANNEPDPALVPASAVSGVVVGGVPLAGFVLAFLGVPSGIACVVSTLVALLLGVWLIEERSRPEEPGATEVVDGLPA